MRGVCLALDTPARPQAEEWINAFAPLVGAFKVGPVLFHAWPGVLAAAKATGRPVFLDLKLHDIPNTVALAVAGLAVAGADWVTCHLAGGPEMLRAGVAAGEGKTKIIGVGVLTSLSDEDWGRFAATAPAAALGALVEMGLEGGVADFVSPGGQVATVRAAAPAATIWVPGIRFAGQGAQDQKRVSTPESAFAAGADWLVLGRALTGVSPDEAQALIATL